MIPSMVWAAVGVVPLAAFALVPLPRAFRDRVAVPVFCVLLVFRSVFALVVWRASLTPDTSEYEAGHAWWSSAVSAWVGYSWGWWGLAAESAVSVVVLGFVVYRRVRARPCAAGLRWVVFLCGPPSWFLAVASADALGVAAFALAYRLRPGVFGRFCVLGAVGACHLVCGLTLACVWGLRDRVPVTVVAIGCGVLACAGEADVQVRYFLPGLVCLVCEPEVWEWLSSVRSRFGAGVLA